jgi:ATP-binding cassette subfamily C protein
MGLLAVGIAGTALITAPRSRLEAMAQDPQHIEDVADLLNTWINGLSLGLSTNLVVPRHYALLDADAEVNVEPGAVIRARKGVLWASVPSGLARFMGWEELPLMGDDDFLPITESTWLQAVSTDTLRAVNTQTFLRQQISWSCLENFHRMALDLIIWNVERDQRIEKERLKTRAAFDDAALQNAMTCLTAILTPKAEAVVLADAGLEEPLVTACRLVGNALGIQIRARPDPVDGQAEAQTLASITEASRVRARRVALRGDWWRHDNGPLLAFYEADNRPLALLPTGSGRYAVHDPAERSQQPVTADLAARIASFAHSFYRPLPDHLLGWRDVLRFGLYDTWRDLAMVLWMGLAGGLLAIAVPIATGFLFDAVIPNEDRTQLFLLTGVLLAGAVAGALFQLTRGIAVLRLESRLDASVQAAVWDRLLQLPAPFFRSYTAGDLSARALGISTIRQAVSGTVVLSILSGLFSVFNFLILFFIDDGLALLATGLVLAAIGVTMLTGYLQTRHQRELTNLQGKISGMVLEIITGISKLRIAGVESRVFAYWAKEFSQQRRLAFTTRSVANRLTIFNAAYPVLATIAIFAIFYDSIGPTRLLTGRFVAFLTAFNQFLFAGLQLSSALVSLLRVVPVYERAQPILQASPEVNETKADPGELLGEIEISRVAFRYKEKGPLVLDNVSLHIKRGEFVALVGPSGSGKSTLLRLLLGFETPESGAIYYDGRNLNSLDIRGLRRQLGVVLQNSQVIAGDILTNIIGQSQLTIDDAWIAARLAGLEDAIREMPMGMHTFISAGGGALSGGQRQRLLIARALARKPRILLFDEATSALDNQTQAVVSESLEGLDATRVVIAHRLSTIIKADRIIVMNKGRIIQEGPYGELMAQEDGLFAQLARRQLA